MATIAIPIETTVRELYGKTWLAAHLAANDHKVYIGDKSHMRLSLFNKIKPDIFIDKDIKKSEKKENMYQSLSNSGCQIIYIDAEGVFKSDQDYFEKRIKPNVDMLSYIDLILSLGEIFSNIIKDRTSCTSNQIITTGNPRFDLCHQPMRKLYEPKSKIYNMNYGDYILLNSNFAHPNHYSGIENKKGINVKEYKIEKYLFHEFISLIHYLSNELLDENQLKLVIRPHPVENIDFYRKEFEEFNNIIVRHRGDVRSWILGSKATIHNSCTTGIESALLNVLPIAYTPEVPWENNRRSPLPNIVSDQATTKREVVDKVLKCISKGEKYQMNKTQRKELKSYFHNASKPSISQVTSEIEKLIESGTETTYPDASIFIKLLNRVKKSSIGSIVKSIQSENRGETLGDQKRGSINISDIQIVFDRLKNELPKEEYKVTRMNSTDNIYIVVG